MSNKKFNRRKLLQAIGIGSSTIFADSLNATKKEIKEGISIEYKSIPDVYIRSLARSDILLNISIKKGGKTITQWDIQLESIEKGNSQSTEEIQFPEVRGEIQLVIRSDNQDSVEKNLYIPTGGIPEFRGEVIDIKENKINTRTVIDCMNQI